MEANTNSVLIWTMVISALTPVLAALVVWITKKSTELKLDKQEMKLDKQAEVIEKIHVDGNSRNAIMAEELKMMRLKVEELVKANSTLIEKQRGQEIATAVKAAITPTP